MDAQTSQKLVQFEQFRLDQRAGILLRRTGEGKFEPVVLGSRAIAVLCTLVERGGDLVSKDEIATAVWRGRVVEGSNLTVQISALRRVLDQGRRQGSCIQTVARRGYRFVPSVARIDEAVEKDGYLPLDLRESPTPGPGIKVAIAGAFAPTALLCTGGWGTPYGGAQPPALTATQPAQVSDRRQSTIILPFENGSSDRRQDGLAAEVTREVTNRILSQADGAVITGMAALGNLGKQIDPRGIGREHDVHFVLTGNARRQKGSLIVTAVLYETAGGGPVWGRELNMPDGPDALPIIAQVIYENSWQKSVDLEAWHAANDHPDHLDKRDLILIALATPLQTPTKANYLQKLSLVDRALSLDPNYLRGLERQARLLAEFVMQGYSSDPTADLALATEAANHALAIDPHAQLSLRVKAAVLRASGEWTEAEAVQRRVLALQPTESFRYYELGLILMAQGHHQDALRSFQTARRSAGGANAVYAYDAEIALAHLALSEFADAIAEARAALGEMPPDCGRIGELPWLALVAAAALSGNGGSARADLQKFLAEPRSWCSVSEIQKWAAFAANPKLIDGLRRAGMPAG